MGLMGYGWGGYPGECGFSGGFGGWIFSIAFLILLAVGIFFLVKSQKKRAKKNPLEIAKERYAKGEISKEEFLKLKEHLS